METIFDHNPTNEELKAHFSKVISKEKHLAKHFSQDTEYAFIYSLYKMRGDEAHAAKYRSLIPPEYLQSCVDLNDIVPASKA